MMTKAKHVKFKKYTDQDIQSYCESVEKLLAKIHARRIAKKVKKVMEV
jgi:predicted house-cleaning NTP pyrophosphatase (Maf/HAM1 superfamily)